jgi:hypothetical protein
MRKIIPFFFLFMPAVISPSYAAEGTAAREVKKIVGTVVTVDWVASEIVVRYYDGARGAYDELTFEVPGSAKLYRGAERIALSDIEQGDEVEVEFYGRGFGGLKVISILDNNLENS